MVGLSLFSKLEKVADFFDSLSQIFSFYSRTRKLAPNSFSFSLKPRYWPHIFLLLDFTFWYLASASILIQDPLLPG